MCNNDQISKHRKISLTSDVLTQVYKVHLKTQDTQTLSGLSHGRKQQLKESALEKCLLNTPDKINEELPISVLMCNY